MLNIQKKKMWILMILVVMGCISYLCYDAYFHQWSLFQYVLSLRIPTLVVMLIAAFAIGSASMIFQSIIQNRIVTPCLLGMNAMYTLIHTFVVFIFGTHSLIATNANLAFLIDILLMSVVGTIIYSYLFQKTGNNILYILLIGTVLSSLFGSMQSTMIRMMDPNEYDTLLTTLVADFQHVNIEIIIISIVLLAFIAFFLRKDLALLDVITLGKDQAINLGVNYDASIKRLLLGVVLCISIATAMVGPISFLGLIVANIARQLLKTYRHQYLILASAMVGMIAMISGQMISQHIFHYAVPVSTFITLIGGIYFLYLLLFQKGGA